MYLLRVTDFVDRFPFTVHETVSSRNLILSNTVAPIILIAIIALLFVPGSTVPRGTPKSLIWKRKLWELHIGWLGLALSLISAYFITVSADLRIFLSSTFYPLLAKSLFELE